MAGYILVDVKTRNILIPCAIGAAFLFVIGVIIGYFSAPRTEGASASPCSLRSAIEKSCHLDISSETTRLYLERYTEKDMTSCIKDQSECNTYRLPRNYVANHLSGKQIIIDGKLDDPAWQEVPWTENFVDMRSTVYPVPYLDTKVKIRWDDTRLYVGAYLQEPNLWATLTEPDSSIWRENGFEMLLDVDNSMFNYKQMQINVLGTMMYTLYFKTLHGEPGKNELSWDADAQSAVYAEGTINTPGDVDQYWTAEMSFTFKALASKSYRLSHITPEDGEVWFMNFGRSEQTLNITENNTYVKARGVPADWWSWQPCGAINLHLQDRWGLVQFSRSPEEPFYFKYWHLLCALFDILDAEKKHKALNAKYTDNIAELDFPPYLLTEVCVDIPTIKLTQRDGRQDFLATVKSRLFANESTLHIRSDRYVMENDYS